MLQCLFSVCKTVNCGHFMYLLLKLTRTPTVTFVHMYVKGNLCDHGYLQNAQYFQKFGEILFS